MDNGSGKISAIISDEIQLELVANELLANAVARQNLSVQGSPTKVAEKYGVPYVAPEVIQAGHNPPETDPYLRDDFGWLIGFSYGIPIFVLVAIGVFLIGDIHSPAETVFFAVIGFVLGGIIGRFIAKNIKENRNKDIEKQERKGGFVLWVSYNDMEQKEDIIRVLNQCHVKAVQG
ncbi:hypothetical protein DIZ81_04950 [Legionella taurinensis]|uniref:Uncharacterized protein n=1 Tax=Legionella taurinensis TaxID=70611 RepID=A0A3A5LAJ5_9GAMM|nr:hypothetical protein [Legionella taurinensis]MDX1837021.1 hypothetical protein [Legionella taurinensis]PUT41426.1 hypothetical protein DB744_04950 [Legionella taurinensis]PUT42665.1 hypothetical protein DB746_07285 [Legionella taurinensis]PUT46693.1 hypothetical protein DB743_04685 [Legionella taurinensis]PUT47342.1 hypothetical protein DB745_08365 [Legionella taurinensis]